MFEYGQLLQAWITDVLNHNDLLYKPAYIQPPTAHALYPKHMIKESKLMYLNEWKDGSWDKIIISNPNNMMNI